MKISLITFFIISILFSCQPKKEIADSPSFEKDLKYLQSYFHIPGMAAVVTKNNKIIYEQNFGTADLKNNVSVDSSTIFPIASVTKIFATTLIMKLVQDNKLSLDEPINNYLDNSNLSDSIKVKHILSHTSEGVPGSFFNYSPRYSILTSVIEKASNMPFDEMLKEEILDPLSLKNTHPISNEDVQVSLAGQMAKPYYFYGEVEDGHYDIGVSAASGLASTTRDISKFMNALYTGKLISVENFNKIATPFNTTHEKSPYGLGIFSQQFLGKKILWGYGQEDCFASLVIIIPEDELTLTLLANNNLMSDPPRLINGDLTYSLFAMSFLKNYAFDLPHKFEMKDWDSPEEISYDFSSSEYGVFYRQEMLANALAASFMSQADEKELDRSSKLLSMAFKNFPNYTEYGNLSLMRALSVNSESDANKYGSNLETLGTNLLEKYEYNPYANIYMAYYYQSQGLGDKALSYYQKIAEAPNFRPFWYTLEALNFLGLYYKENNPELAKANFQKIVDIGWNMGGVVDRAKTELEKLEASN